MRLTKVKKQKRNSTIFQYLRSITLTKVKVMLLKFKPDLYFVVISIVYKFHNNWLTQTKVKERKPIMGCTDRRTCMYRCMTRAKT